MIFDGGEKESRRGVWPSVCLLSQQTANWLNRLLLSVYSKDTLEKNRRARGEEATINRLLNSQQKKKTKIDEKSRSCLLILLVESVCVTGILREIRYLGGR